MTLMQGIYNYAPEIDHFSTVYSVAAVLYLQFVLHVMLFRPWNMFCTSILALSAVCVQCPIWLFFCISLISCFPVILLRYCLRDLEMVPFAHLITGIIFVFTFHVWWISVMRFYTLKYSQLLSRSHFCLQELQHQLTFMFPFYCYGLLCPVYC